MRIQIAVGGIRLYTDKSPRARKSATTSGWLSHLGSRRHGPGCANSATAGAVQAAASAGTRFTALDLKVNLLRAVEADGTELLAEAKVVHRGSRLVIANTNVTRRGRTVAVSYTHLTLPTN